MNLDLIFRGLGDATRRLVLDELAERDGQTMFELHVRLTTWHQAALSRQALAKHLKALEEAGLIRTEWAWRSKHHFLEREPLRAMWKLWLENLASQPTMKGSTKNENRCRERAGR